MSEWKEHDGGPQPGETEEKRVEVEDRIGKRFLLDANHVDWLGGGFSTDVIRYRLIDTPSPEEVSRRGTPEPVDESIKTLRDEFAMVCPKEEVERRLPKTIGEMRDELIRRGRIPESAKNLDILFSYCEADVQWLHCRVRYEFADAMLAARKEK